MLRKFLLFVFVFSTSTNAVSKNSDDGRLMIYPSLTSQGDHFKIKRRNSAIILEKCVDGSCKRIIKFKDGLIAKNCPSSNCPFPSLDIVVNVLEYISGVLILYREEFVLSLILVKLIKFWKFYGEEEKSRKSEFCEFVDLLSREDVKKAFHSGYSIRIIYKQSFEELTQFFANVIETVGIS